MFFKFYTKHLQNIISSKDAIVNFQNYSDYIIKYYESPKTNV